MNNNNKEIAPPAGQAKGAITQNIKGEPSCFGNHNTYPQKNQAAEAIHKAEAYDMMKEYVKNAPEIVRDRLPITLLFLLGEAEGICEEK